jgi:hypothetical protein
VLLERGASPARQEGEEREDRDDEQDGWTMVPPAIAMISSTTPMTSHNMTAPLAWSELGRPG